MIVETRATRVNLLAVQCRSAVPPQRIVELSPALRVKTATQRSGRPHPSLGLDDRTFAIRAGDREPGARYTIARELAREREGVELIGLDHPLMAAALQRWQHVDADQIGVAVAGDDAPAVVPWWLIRTAGNDGEHSSLVQPLAVTPDGKRLPKVERAGAELFSLPPAAAFLSADQRRSLLHDTLEPMLARELSHRGLLPADGGYSTKLIGWVEVAGVAPTAG